MRNIILRRLRNNKGLSLPEVLVSSGIIILVFVIVILVFVQTSEISKKANLEYVSANLAKNHLERARTLMETKGFSSLVDLAETDTLLNGAGGTAGSDLDFQRTTSVTPNYGSPADPKLTRVDVTVVYKYRGSWNTGAGVTFSTIFVNME
jgi:type II secretory pathway pseudopilin PulG